MARLPKSLVVLLLLFSAPALYAQKFSATNGTIHFSSNASLEVISATSDKVQGLIDPTTNQFAFIVRIKSFTGFNSNLQREHFNDKYLESDKFYDASYSGKILDPIPYTTDGTYEVRTKGNLIIHGKKQARMITGKVKVENGTLTVTSEFRVPLTDHDIQIPQILTEKIATEIIVKINLTLVRK